MLPPSISGLSLAPLTFSLSHVLFLFYNQLYIGELACAGYKVQSVAGGDLDAVRKKLGMDVPLLETA